MPLGNRDTRAAAAAAPGGHAQGQEESAWRRTKARCQEIGEQLSEGLGDEDGSNSDGESFQQDLAAQQGQYDDPPTAQTREQQQQQQLEDESLAAVLGGNLLLGEERPMAVEPVAEPSAARLKVTEETHATEESNSAPEAAAAAAP